MQPNKPPIPFINVRTQENRTPTGRRTSTPAKRAALYYAFGRDQSRDSKAQQAGRQRGEWLGPDGRVHSQEEVMAWIKANALAQRYTFQGLLSVPEGELTAAEFGQALQKGGQTAEWRLIAHNDTQHRHAHVLWFGDRRMDKQTFLVWQRDVRAELVRLEQQQKSVRPMEQDLETPMDRIHKKQKGMELG